jgi:hypothetical protein
MTRLLLVLSLLALGACATPIPFNTVTLGGEPTVVSNKPASLTLVSGAVRGSSNSMLMPAGGIYVPVSTGEVPELQFHAKNQEEFIGVLRSELTRLRVFPEVALGSDSPAAQFKITVLFAQTFHRIQNQEYTLDVAMEIQGGKEPFLKQYRVNSNEGATLMKKWNTNAYQGKALAVRRLLEALVPDIQRYVAENA